MHENAVREEAKAILKMYGYDRIKRGFMDKDPTIERALKHLGECANEHRNTDKMKPHILVFEGWEVVQGL